MQLGTFVSVKLESKTLIINDMNNTPFIKADAFQINGVPLCGMWKIYEGVNRCKFGNGEVVIALAKTKRETAVRWDGQYVRFPLAFYPKLCSLLSFLSNTLLTEERDNLSSETWQEIWSRLVTKI